jgi:hypothetical protein
MIFHTLTQGPECFGEDFGHQEQGWSDIEAVAVSLELIAAAAGASILFEYSNRVTGAGQSGGGSDPAETGADYQCCRLSFHGALLKMGHSSIYAFKHNPLQSDNHRKNEGNV